MSEHDSILHVMRRFDMTMRMIAGALTFASALFFASAAVALEPAEGEVLLTVTGAIGQTNAGDAAAFDLAALEGMETALVIETTTIWTEGMQTFEGVALVDLLAAIEAEGANLRAIALNDYAVDIPVSDARRGWPDRGLPAQRRDDEPA